MKSQALVQVLVMALVGTAFFLYGKPVVAGIVWGLAVFFLFLSLAAPSIYETTQALAEQAAIKLTAGIGLGTLVLVYLTIFTAGSLWMRLRGRDPMNRRFPSGGESNWVTRVGFGSDEVLYTKQFTRPHHAEPGEGRP